MKLIEAAEHGVGRFHVVPLRFKGMIPRELWHLESRSPGGIKPALQQPARPRC